MRLKGKGGFEPWNKKVVLKIGFISQDKKKVSLEIKSRLQAVIR